MARKFVKIVPEYTVPWNRAMLIFLLFYYYDNFCQHNDMSCISYSCMLICFFWLGWHIRVLNRSIIKTENRN